MQHLSHRIGRSRTAFGYSGSIYLNPARRYAQLSPRVRRMRRGEGNPTTSKPGSRPAENKATAWPLSMIEAAYRSGNLPISPLAATAILDGFANLVQRTSLQKGHVQDFIPEHEVPLKVLTTLGKIVLRSSGSSPPNLGLNLLAAASRLEDEDATMILVEEGLKHGRPPDLGHAKLQDPLKHLQKLANNRNTAAMVLSARVQELRGDADKSLRAFKDVIREVPEENRSKEDPSNASLSEAWEGIARLEGNLGNHVKEREALDAAALKYDNPTAFHRLATLTQSESPAKSEEYFQKAAISGMGDAAFEMGKSCCLQIEESQNHTSPSPNTGARTRESDVPRQYLTAMEWFLIAMESQRCERPAHARLHTARILRKTGEAEKSARSLMAGLQQLQLQREHGLVQFFKENWPNPRFNPTCRELDVILQDWPAATRQA